MEEQDSTRILFYQQEMNLTSTKRASNKKLPPSDAEPAATKPSFAPASPAKKLPVRSHEQRQQSSGGGGGGGGGSSSSNFQQVSLSSQMPQPEPHLIPQQNFSWEANNLEYVRL
jgi:hypothetical protein